MLRRQNAGDRRREAACFAASLVAAFALGACVAPAEELDRRSDDDAMSAADVVSASYQQPRIGDVTRFATIGRFVGFVDPARGELVIAMVDEHRDAGAAAGELAGQRQALLTDTTTGWCRATVERDGTEGTGSTGTVELYTPEGEIDLTVTDCLDRIGDSSLTAASFPNGVLCADVVVRSFFEETLEDVFAEITVHDGGSNQYGYAFPLGTGAQRPSYGRDRPAPDFGLWGYGDLGPADGHIGAPYGDPPDEKTVVWTFKYGSTTPFTFEGRLIYGARENCGNGRDDDCDEVVDNGCGTFEIGDDCYADADCVTGSCAGVDLDEDVAGTCERVCEDGYYGADCTAECPGGATSPCNGNGTCDDGVGGTGTCDCYAGAHGDACDATCSDGELNGDEVGLDCGGPCAPGCDPIAASSVNTETSAIRGERGGTAVSGDGGWIAVGSPNAPYRSTSLVGGVRVYRDDGAGGWQLHQALSSPAIERAGRFGTSVALCDNRLFVGAPYHDVTVAGRTARDAGVVYVYDHDKSTDVWSRVASLSLGSSGRIGDLFGWSVACASASTAIVGVPRSDASRYSDAGAVAGIVDSGSGPVVRSLHYDSSLRGGEQMGYSVAIQRGRASTAVVGAPFYSSGRGAVFVLNHSSGRFSAERRVTASGAQAGDYLGYSVAIDPGGRVAFGGAPEASVDGAARAGFVQTIRFNGTYWGAGAKIESPDAAGGYEFGDSISAAATVLAVGEPRATVGSATTAGRVWVYDDPDKDGVYSMLLRLTDDEPTSADMLGTSVSMAGVRRVTAGAPGVDDPSKDAGALFVWDLEAPPRTCDPGFYGTWCATECPGGASDPCSGNGTCSEGTTGDGSCTCDAGYYGEACAGSCSCTNGTCDDGAAGDGSCTCDDGWGGDACDVCAEGHFGSTCASCPTASGQICSGRGTCDDGLGGTGECDCGSFHGDACEGSCTDKRINGDELGVDCGGPCTRSCSYSAETRLEAAAPSASADFGTAVAASDGFVFVGEPDALDGGNENGAVTVYEYDDTDGSWTRSQTLRLPAGTTTPDFGASLAACNGWLFVGAPGQTISGAADAGSVYAYQYDAIAGSWATRGELRGTVRAGDRYGWSVSCSSTAEYVFVGAPYADRSGVSNVGAVFSFQWDGTRSKYRLLRAQLASSGSANDFLGTSVAWMSSNEYAAGAPGHDIVSSWSSRRDVGHVLAFQATVANEFATVATGSADGDSLGAALAGAGSRLVIGAPGHDASASARDSGKALLYRRTTTRSWTLEATFQPSDPAAGDGAGDAVAYGGGSVVVGIPGADSDGNSNSGRALLYQYDSRLRSWPLSRIFVSSTSHAGASFGASVAASRTPSLFAFGAPGEDISSTGSAGAAYVFVD